MTEYEIKLIFFVIGLFVMTTAVPLIVVIAFIIAIFKRGKNGKTN